MKIKLSVVGNHRHIIYLRVSKLNLFLDYYGLLRNSDC
ncbi:hypothetical protein RDI58_010800 [Solanum bulbocastanum]|uniref:Uncharacterized protein n=1 Tax=Solanum bulbocastanum TaxID=147425 RepID=A0AAN8TRL2_SOLBU